MYRKTLIALACLCLASTLKAGTSEAELSMETIKGLFQNVNVYKPSPPAHITGVFTVARAGDLSRTSSTHNFDVKWSGQKMAVSLDPVDDQAVQASARAGEVLNIRAVLTENESRDFYGTLKEEGESSGSGIIKDAPNPSTRSTDDLDRILKQAVRLTEPRFDPGNFLDAYREMDGEKDLIFVVFRDHGLIYRIGLLLNEGGIISRYEVFINGEKKLDIRHDQFITTEDGKRFPSQIMKRRFKTTYIPADLLERLETPYTRESLDKATASELTTYTIQVDSANLNPVFADDDFQLIFPSGIFVEDEREQY